MQTTDRRTEHRAQTTDHGKSRRSESGKRGQDGKVFCSAIFCALSTVVYGLLEFHRHHGDVVLRGETGGEAVEFVGKIAQEERKGLVL